MFCQNLGTQIIYIPSALKLSFPFNFAKVILVYMVLNLEYPFQVEISPFPITKPNEINVNNCGM